MQSFRFGFRDDKQHESAASWPAKFMHAT